MHVFSVFVLIWVAWPLSQCWWIMRTRLYLLYMNAIQKYIVSKLFLYINVIWALYQCNHADHPRSAHIWKYFKSPPNLRYCLDMVDIMAPAAGCTSADGGGQYFNHIEAILQVLCGFEGFQNLSWLQVISLIVLIEEHPSLNWRYTNSHYKVETIIRLDQLYNGNTVKHR